MFQGNAFQHNVFQFNISASSASGGGGGSTTLEYQIANANHDSHMVSIANDSGRNVVSAGVVFLDDTLLEVGSHSSGDEWSILAWFPGIDVPQGETIQSASFLLNGAADYSTGNTIQLLVSAQAADNAGSPTTTPGDLSVSVRPRTAASSLLDVATVASGVWYAADVTPQIQEVVNRGGWAASNAVAVIVDTAAETTTGEWQDFVSYDSGSPLRAPKLSITIGASGGGPVIVVLSGYMQPMGIW